MPLTAILIAFALLHAQPAPTPGPARSIAITIDDLPTASVLGGDLDRAESTTRALVAAIRRARIPAIGFVNERQLQAGGQVDPRRVALLEQWLDAGLELGNHTFSHVDLHRVPLETFQQDALAGEQTLRRILGARGLQPRYFRHPFLHTGRTLEIKRAVTAFLQARGYTVAPVTIDNYDYVFAAAYDRATAAGDAAAARRIADAYKTYMQSVVEYYEKQSVLIVGREIAQTWLLHANALNAATLEPLVDWLRGRGYRFVSLEQALKDAAYASADEYVGPAGMTWLHRWALTQGKRGAIFAGEPSVPDWVERAAAAR